MTLPSLSLLTKRTAYETVVMLLDYGMLLRFSQLDSYQSLALPNHECILSCQKPRYMGTPQ